ncbi:class I tRNA ligase family protein [Actinomadura rubrisoli]|uniref:Methionine--tRNA ligase n=1 Tax=Actinomadura rubrisoli TaxID=2530368 RepID=A0A4R5BHV5_9ACTN|nr:class I tRNA ligase family protein [Actinomadura rubrisoli]TDD84490.1 methionine--tRNA ligase [Actinomadura rubrisoli]
MTERTVVISPAPTANGDLHLGHLAGPFLAADVYTRYLRATGRTAYFGTGFQDTSTFVVTTAKRRGVTPKALVAESAEQIASTLDAVGIGVDGFTGDDERFTKWVADFWGRVHGAGKLELKTMDFLYSPKTGRFLVDGFAAGGCPLCLADGCAGLCETCGNPIAAADLIDPRSTLDPDDPVEPREARVLVLPMERYRERLRAYFDGHTTAMRPHMAQALREMLSRPLPDYPVTYPISWGIPAPFPEVAGQVFNPNAEPAAWSMHASALSAERCGEVPVADDALWRPGSGTKVVYFLGFDNTYPFAVAMTAVLLAHGDQYALPAEFITNEFYLLDHEKFSTSRGHVVGGRELAAEVPRDLIRFHLAATSPENQCTNFSREAMAKVTRSWLAEPWNRVAAKADQWAGRGPLPVSEGSRGAAARIIDRFAASYELDCFSLTRAAGTLTEQIARLDRWDVAPGEAGDFCHEIDVVLRCAAPILIDLAAAALPDTAIRRAAPATVTPVRLPRLGDRHA